MPGTQRSQARRASPASAESTTSARAVALLLDRVTRARVIEALRPHTTVVFVETSADLLACVRGVPISLVILEFRDRGGSQTLPAVQSIRRGFPSIPIVAYTTPGRTPSSDILAMAHAGVHELIMQGFDDVGIALRTVVESAARRCAATRVISALESDLPEGTIPFVQFCLERAWRPPTVTEAAAYLGVHRKTLVYRFRRTRLPPPSAMISWCRLFVAGHLLEDPRRSVAHVALALDFSSSAALRGMLRRYTGLRSQEIREHGGLESILAAFRSVLLASPVSAASDNGLPLTTR